MVKKKSPEKKVNFKYNVREYARSLGKYKFYVFLILFTSLLVEASHLVPKILLKEIVDKGNLLLTGDVVKAAFVSLLLSFAYIYIGAVLVRTVGSWYNLHYINKIEVDMMFDMKKKYFNHIVHLDHNFHTTHKTGSLISRLNRGAGSVERMTDVIAFNVMPLIFQLIIVGISVIYFSSLSFFLLIAITIGFIGFSLYLQQKQKTLNVLMNEAEDREKANIADIFTNIDSIKYFGKENKIKTRYEKLALESRSTMLRFLDYFKHMSAGQSLIVGIGTVLFIVFPIIGFLKGEISMGTVVFIYSIYGNLVGPMYGFVHGIRGYYRSMADFEDLFNYGKVKNEIEDKPGSKKLEIEMGEIEFRDIYFRYKKGKSAINGLSLKIKPDEKIALVGHSGCGKTTLVKLLYRFFDVDSGLILIDNKNIKDFKQESLRSELSIVPQEAILFDDTIYNNIAFSNPNATKEDIVKAMKFAQLDKLVMELPNKENTIVGERGVKLSGGEKQRVSIARAILADKKVLVLDEATSSLDSETEFEIQRDLQKLMQGRTSIIIAHRLSTIMKADRIIVLEKGKIVQMGNHKELINQQGQYKKLWNLQKGGYIKE